MQLEFVETVEAGFRALTPNLRELADRFYAHLFSRFPGLRAEFPRDLTETKQRFVATLTLVVRHARAHEALRPALLQMGHEHGACGMQPDHYTLVRDLLLEILGDMLAPEWNEQVQYAWSRAINYATAVMSEGMCEPTLMYA